MFNIRVRSANEQQFADDVRKLIAWQPIREEAIATFSAAEKLREKFQREYRDYTRLSRSRKSEDLIKAGRAYQQWWDGKCAYEKMLADFGRETQGWSRQYTEEALASHVWSEIRNYLEAIERVRVCIAVVEFIDAATERDREWKNRPRYMEPTLLMARSLCSYDTATK